MRALHITAPTDARASGSSSRGRIHDRMPVILAPDDYPAWLGEDAVRDMAELLRPCPSEAMRAYRVSRR